METVLGIDPGLADTGYAVLRRSGQNLTGSVLEAGLIQTDPRGQLPLRLRDLYQGVVEICRQYRPDVLVVEDLYTHYRHPRTAILMGHARGVVLLAAAEVAARIQHLAPARIKKALTGNGYASKRQVKLMTQQILGLPAVPEPDHVADAMAAAICYYFTVGGTLQRQGGRR